MLAELNRIGEEKRAYLSPMHVSFVYIGLGDKESVGRA
jgi:hypothetical protein